MLMGLILMLQAATGHTFEKVEYCYVTNAKTWASGTDDAKTILAALDARCLKAMTDAATRVSDQYLAQHGESPENHMKAARLAMTITDGLKKASREKALAAILDHRTDR